MDAAVTPSVIVVAEEKGSSKPVSAEDKGKGPTKIEVAKEVLKIIHHLGKGLLTKIWVVEGTWFIMLQGKLWVQSSWPKLSALLNNLDALRGPPSSREGQMITCIAARIIWKLVIPNL
jgi:hypothetical protein